MTFGFTLVFACPKDAFTKEFAMSTVFSLSSKAAVQGTHGAERGTYRTLRRFDGSRSLATLLLAAAVAALVVLAEQMIGTWADGHLFLGWVALWVVIFASSVLFAGSARRLARSTVRSLDSWSASLAEARAEARLWDLARTDPRLKAELMQARARASELAQEADAVAASTSAFKASRDGDFAQALAPLGLDSGFSAPMRRSAQQTVLRKSAYLPYL
jgi:hypothetical protein